MESQFDTLKHLGPLTAQAHIAAFCEFDEQVWQRYRQLATQHGPVTHGSREYLVVRMMYIAEVTSNAIRMNATWMLTPAAMSLLRDRYEQTVRFSWLARNPDQKVYIKYERALFGTLNVIARNVDAETIRRFEKRLGPVPGWAIAKPTKEQEAQFKAWPANLRALAKQRDGFPPVADTNLAKAGLARWYDSIYKQFSSVSHYDRFSIEMVKLCQNPNGSFGLSLESHWPGLLIFFAGYLDMIQCLEATRISLEQDASTMFEGLFTEWHVLSQQFRDI